MSQYAWVITQNTPEKVKKIFKEKGLDWIELFDMKYNRGVTTFSTPAIPLPIHDEIQVALGPKTQVYDEDFHWEYGSRKIRMLAESMKKRIAKKRLHAVKAHRRVSKKGREYLVKRHTRGRY